MQDDELVFDLKMPERYEDYLMPTQAVNAVHLSTRASAPRQVLIPRQTLEAIRACCYEAKEQAARQTRCDSISFGILFGVIFIVMAVAIALRASGILG